MRLHQRPHYPKPTNLPALRRKCGVGLKENSMPEPVECDTPKEREAVQAIVDRSMTFDEAERVLTVRTVGTFICFDSPTV